MQREREFLPGRRHATVWWQRWDLSYTVSSLAQTQCRLSIYSDIADSDTESGLSSPDPPVRDRKGPNTNDTDYSEVIINRNAGRRGHSRSREMVNIPRTDLNNLYDEMRQLRNEVYRVRNRTQRLDIQQRNHRDSSSDELDVKKQ